MKFTTAELIALAIVRAEELRFALANRKPPIVIEDLMASLREATDAYIETQTGNVDMFITVMASVLDDEKIPF